MEDSKLLFKHCKERSRMNCNGCKHHRRCEIVSTCLVAKRLVYLAKRKVLMMFAKKPKSRAASTKGGYPMFLLHAVVACICISSLISFFIPVFGMAEVTASDQISEELVQEELVYEVTYDDFDVPSQNVTELKEPAQAASEVATEVAVRFIEDYEPVIQDIQEPEPVTREEKLESIMPEYDIPLDYDVDLAFQGMDYLVNEQGFSYAGAAGVMGNFYAECRFDSSLIGGSHKGLAQWDSSYRWPMVAEWLTDNGYDLTSYYGQLNAIFYSDDANEFTHGNPYSTFDKMRQATDPREAALVWLYEYERAPGQAEITRQDMAELTYELYTRSI